MRPPRYREPSETFRPSKAARQAALDLWARPPKSREARTLDIVSRTRAHLGIYLALRELASDRTYDRPTAAKKGSDS